MFLSLFIRLKEGAAIVNKEREREREGEGAKVGGCIRKGV